MTAAGVTRTFLTSKAPFRDGRGNVIGLVGISRDISDRKRSEQRIAEQAALIDQARDAIYERDMDDRITFWSKGAERIYGWSAEEALGRLADELLAADTAKVPPSQSHRSVRETGVWQGETQRTAKDGTFLVLDGRMTLVRDANGQPRSILSIDTDITARKKIEQQLLRSQRMESIGTLAGGIAHDLNNVLAPIIMALDLMKSRFPDSASQDLLSVISSSAHRGAEMVRQVLSFARGVEGRRVAVDMGRLIRDIEKVATDTFFKHNHVRTRIPHDLWPVNGDPTQLHQVLMNLSVNARDAMPDGGTLTLSAANIHLDSFHSEKTGEAMAGPYVAIHVEDSGTGMTGDVVEKIFDPFFTTKEVGKGTGLGLSTSLAIVKSHGGFMQCYSEPGKGTKITVYLPALTDVSPVSPVRKAVTMPRGDDELILVVDDESSVRQITQRTLEAYGYRVLLAADGAEAVASFAAHLKDIAVVLTDMTMPVMDGAATIQILRRMDPHVKIIAASGLSAGGQDAKVRSLGVKCFLPKPYTGETLLGALHQVLAGD
jgi:PAS domain S-box-containing protein